MIQIDMPMPDNCDECRFNTEYGFCKAMPDNFCGNTDDRKRPEWCPLKEQETEIDEIADEYLDLGSEMAKQPEIVRCKDCVYAESFMESYRCYFDEENESGCKRSHDADFFCAYGERKD